MINSTVVTHEEAGKGAVFSSFVHLGDLGWALDLWVLVKGFTLAK